MIKQILWLLSMVFCVAGQLAAQNPTAIHEVNEHIEKTSPQTSDALFIRQNEIYKQAKADADLVKQARALQRMGQICYQMGLFTQSLNYHIKADEIYRSDKNEKQAADNLNDLALLFLITKQEKDAKQSYFKALTTFQRLRDSSGIARTYANIGHYYEKTLNYDSAYFYQKKAMQVFDSIGDAEGAALVHENLGSIYEDKSQFDKAYFHFSKALAWFEQGGNTEMLIDAYNNVGDIYRKQGAYAEALRYTRKAEALAKSTKSYSRLSSAYRDLGKTYSFLKQTDSTFHYLELSRQYFLRSYSEESKNQEALLKVIYGLDRKEIQLAEMARQEKVAWAIYIASGIAAVVFILVAAIIIRNQRHRILKERATSAKEEEILKTKQELMEVDLNNKKLQEEQLKENLHTKAKEITAHTLQTIQKNQLLEDIREALTEMIKSDGRSYKKELRSLLNKINQNFNKDAYWDDFRRIFEEINQEFFDQLQQINPGLSATDIKLISLIKLNVNAADIAALLSVSTDSLRVARYRLRKKLKLEQGASLTAFIQSI
ncbi:MAG: tetratricopeptide repeat protein [Pedobacter sp.]|uniref:tetratricopeptide repeat protein n=1 Tax=Pedobacter sp. TaxID=1411316 RepID=UPI0028066E79|nr:tetratricopeptide repeat protein [Pedobacter sp.]MDQ8006126.1 tetratricopeptide repeat protein [Pedobacter sp.]